MNAVIDTTSIKQPTVMLLNGRGDYLLNMPVLRAISEVFSGQITLVVKKGAHSLFFSDLPAARIIEPEFTMSPAGPLFDGIALAEAIGETDLFLSLNPWHTDSVDDLLFRLHAGHTVGFFSSFDSTIPLDFSRHTSDLAFDVAHCLVPEFSIDQFSQPPLPAGRYHEVAKQVCDQLPSGVKIVVVHGETQPEKMWGDTQFVTVMEWLLEKDPEIFIFDLGLSSIGDDYFSAEPRVVGCCEMILPVAITLIEQADLFIGVDSCFLHAADFYRVPGVGLFGPTSVHEFGFRFGPHRHVSANTMEEISADQVVEAIEDLVGDMPNAIF